MSRARTRLSASGIRFTASPPVSWSIITSTPDITQGQTASWTIAANRVTAGMSIFLRFPLDLIEGSTPYILAGQPDFNNVPGHGNSSVAAACTAAAAATLGVAFESTGNIYKFTFDASFAGTLVINRIAKNFASLTGDKITGFEIYEPSQGIIEISEARVIIRDDFVLTNTVAPLIDDTTPQVDQVLTASPGTFTGGTAPYSYVYQWESRTNGGGGEAVIPGVLGSAFTVGGPQLGLQVRVGVIATDSLSQSSQIAYSAWTTAAAAADPPPTPDGSVGPVPGSFYASVNLAAGSVVGTLTPIEGGTVTGRTLLAMRSVYGVHNSQTPWNDPMDQIGLFEISGANLVVAAGKTLDFVGPNTSILYWSQVPLPVLGPGGTPWYEVQVEYTRQAAANVINVHRIYPKYTIVVPTGDRVGNVGLINSLNGIVANGFVARCRSASVDRTFRIPTTIIGAIETTIPPATASVTSDIPPSQHHCTYEGHPRVIVLKDTKPRVMGGHHLYFKDLAFRVGTDFAGWGQLAVDRDSFDITSGYEIVFENCDFSWSSDELFSMASSHYPVLQPYCRRIRFTRCLFAEPCFAPVHKSEVNEMSHPYGLLVNDYGSEVMIDNCVIMGCTQRTPALYRNWGVTCFNNIFLYGVTGTFFYNHKESMSRQSNCTMRIENNLYKSIWANWRYAAFTTAYIGAQDEIYQAGNYFIGNHNENTRFDDIALDMNLHCYKIRTTDLACFKNYKPFIFENEASLNILPTATAQNRQDLHEFVLDRVGVRHRDGSGNIILGDAAMSEVGARIINRYRKGDATQLIVGNAVEHYATPTAKYSDGTGTGTGGLIPETPSLSSIARYNFPTSSCPAGAGGDACRAAGGYVTGIAGDTVPLLP